MSIVTLSHEMGAGGPEIGQQVAERLGYKYVDHELISDTARRYGLLEEKLEHLDETKPSLFERFDAETRRYITAMQTAFYEFAEQDRVVLMGRGGQWLLRGVSHVLRVRVMAPFDIRVKRLGTKLSGPMGEQASPRTVTEMVRRDDTEKAGRMRYLYDVDVADPALYDLLINTEKLPAAAAIDVIADVTRRPELQTTPGAAQIVADRSLASQVQVALATNAETRKYRITVEAKAGVVTLEGTAAMDEALDVAKGVAGCARSRRSRSTSRPSPPSSPSRGAIRAHLLRWRPRSGAQRRGTTPRARLAGAASQLDPSRPPARAPAAAASGDDRTDSRRRELAAGGFGVGFAGVEVGDLGDRDRRPRPSASCAAISRVTVLPTGLSATRR